MADLQYSSPIGVTHDVAVATQKSLVYIRESYINLHGMPCRYYTLNEQSSPRNDIYGDISHKLELKYMGDIRIVLDTPSLFRRVHHHYHQSDEFSVDPIKGEVSIDTNIREGDVVRVDLEYLTQSSLPLDEEKKYWQVVKVESFSYVRDISKIVKLAPYRDEF